MIMETRTRSQSSNLHPRPGRPRKNSKLKKPIDFEDSRGCDTREPSMDSNQVDDDGDNDGADSNTACCSNSINELEESCDELGFRSSKDLVWAKAYPYIWWPGWIRREYRGKFLVSFFGSDRSLWYRDSEMRSFEDYFEVTMLKKIGGKRLQPDVIDCALAEFGRRLIQELSCSCQEEAEDRKRAKPEGKDLFQPVEVLDFVLNTAVSPSYEEIESVDVIRAAALVNAFRRHAFIKRDWIYEETMRVAETVGDLEANVGDLEANTKSICSEPEIKCSVVHEVESSDEEECSVVHEVESSDEEEEPEEQKVEEMEVEVEEVEGVGGRNPNEFVEQQENGSVICKINFQEYPIERSQVAVKEVFQPAEILAFVHKLAVSPWVDDVGSDYVTKAVAQVNTFRSCIFIKHDWIYHKTMRLLESSEESEANMKSAFYENEQPYEVQEEAIRNEVEEDDESIRKFFLERKRSGPVNCKKIVEDPLHDILKHLYCLALDPFYSGPEGHVVNNLDVMRQKILRYRDLVCHQILDNLPPLKNPSHLDGVTETSNTQTLSETSSISHLDNLSVDVPMEDNIGGVANDDETQDSQLLSELFFRRKKKARVERKTEDVQVLSSKSIVEGIVEPVGRDVVDTVRDTADCNPESDSSKRLKIKDVKVRSSPHNVEGSDVADSLKDIPHCNGESESNKWQETADVMVFSTNNVKSLDTNSLRDNPDCNSVSISNKRKNTVDTKDFCRIGNVDAGDVVHRRDNLDSYCESESNKRQKISSLDSVLHFQGGNIETLHGGNSASANDDSPEPKLSSHDLKGHLKIKPCSEASIDGRIVNLEADRRLMLNTFPGDTISEEINVAIDENKVGDLTSKTSSFSPLSNHNTELDPSAGALRNKGLSVGTVSGGNCQRNGIASGGSSHRNGIVSGVCSQKNGRHSQHSIDISVKVQQPMALQPLSVLYKSPLSAVSPASNGNAQIQSSKPYTHPEHPTTLHMKFPKDFKLPSKDELVKQFRQFGPIDYSKTKVFFYTGSAQIVFQHHLDAEAACHYAKRKKNFLGGANVRFWIDQHEQSRRGTFNISAPVTLATTESSIQNLKSCLRISNPQGTKVERKHVHVNFPSANQTPPSVTNETKHGNFKHSNSSKYSKEVSPDISSQMFVLLEKCNHMVTEIKANLGLRSIYSLFRHNYCDTKFYYG